MTLPNKISISRIIVTPFFFLLYYFTQVKGVYSVGALIPIWLLFLWSEVSDVLDGQIARRGNLVSDLGKILDPFSDVFSRVTGFFCFMLIGIMPPVAFAVVLWRELLISFIRTILMGEGQALSAKIGGKIKAVFYFLAGLYGMVWTTTKALSLPSLPDTIGRGLFILAAVASLLSFIEYFALFITRKSEKS